MVVWYAVTYASSCCELLHVGWHICIAGGGDTAAPRETHRPLQLAAVAAA